MSIDCKLFKKDSIVVGRWAGGTTMELAIEPPDAVYAERNFKWRLSSATVELAESVFTYLPQYNRILMILDGEMKLVHDGQYEVKLGKYDQDSFDGGFNTTSYGQVIDYNLMMTKDAKGSLNVIKIINNVTINLDIFTTGNYVDEGFFLHKGNLDVILGNKMCHMDEGELLLISRADNEAGEVIFNGNGTLIQSKVYYNK